MTTPQFDELNVTVMTIIDYLVGNINIYAVIDLFEYVLDAEPLSKNSKKKKIEFKTHPIPGSIINLSFEGVHRGFRHTKNIKFFKNSVSLILSLASKNISIKLGDGNIHITGAKNEDHGRECAGYIIQKVLDIQDHLDLIQSNLPRAHYTTKALLDICKGDQIEAKIEAGIGAEEKEGKMEEKKETKKEDFTLLPESQVREKLKELVQIDGNVDEKIAQFYMRYYKFRDEFPTFSCFEQFIKERCNKVTFIGSRDLRLVHIQKVMSNYNYDIGFNVKRNELTKCIQQMNGNFRVNYDSSLNHTVTVFLPYDPSLKSLPPEVQKLVNERKEKKKQEEDLKKGTRKPRENKKKKKEKKIPKHNFLVYKTGQITFSTNGVYESMKDAYDGFNSIMEELKDIIIQPNKNRKKKVPKQKIQ